MSFHVPFICVLSFHFLNFCYFFSCSLCFLHVLFISFHLPVFDQKRSPLDWFERALKWICQGFGNRSRPEVAILRIWSNCRHDPPQRSRKLHSIMKQPKPNEMANQSVPSLEGQKNHGFLFVRRTPESLSIRMFSIQLHSTAAILFCAKVFERYQIAAVMELPCYIPYFLAFLLIVLRFPLISLVFLCSSRIFFSCSFVSCMFFPSSFHVPFISLSCPFISFHALHFCISFSWFWSVLISFHFDWMSFALFSVSISSNHVHSIFFVSVLRTKTK